MKHTKNIRLLLTAFGCLLSLSVLFRAGHALAKCTLEQELTAINTNKPFYCEDDSTVCTEGVITPVVLPSGNDNAEKIWNFFMSQPGFKPHMAAAFLGNMQEEAHFEPRLVEYGFTNSRGETSRPGKPSSLDDDVPPNAKKNGQPGYGIIQWTFPTRKQALRDKVANDPSRRKAGDLGLQLEHMWTELTTGYKGSTLNPVLASKDVAEATTIITYKFETPTGKEAAAVRRTKYANAWLAKFGSKTPPTAIATPATTDPSTTTPAETRDPVDCTEDGGLGGSGGEQSTITGSSFAAKMVSAALLYAWPEGGHGLTPKPEYAAAVKQFKTGSGRNYNGGSCDAFIATVMKATGADPNYPIGNVVNQMNYVKNNPAKYEVIKNYTIADLRPGDILQVGPGRTGHGHTYMFVGPQAGGRNKADASYSSRMPNLGKAIIKDKRGDYTLVRLK